jgi:UPF0716 family protein affecting phage T7 exclusion
MLVLGFYGRTYFGRFLVYTYLWVVYVELRLVVVVGLEVGGWLGLPGC